VGLSLPEVVAKKKNVPVYSSVIILYSSKFKILWSPLIWSLTNKKKF